MPKSPLLNRESIVDCLDHGRSVTPPEITKYKTKALDLPVPVNHAFGMKTQSSNSMASDLLNPKISRLNWEELERKEQIYKRPEIGRKVSSKSGLDEKLEPAQVFGVRTNSGQRVTEALVQEPHPVDDEVLRRTKISHGHYAVGEQMKRNYEWNVDPMVHSFGSKPRNVEEGVSDTMSWKAPDHSSPTKPHEKLPPLPLHGTTFGVKTQKFDSASEIMHNWPVLETPESSLKAKAKTSEGLFGIPASKSKKDPTRGIYEEDWTKSRAKEELWDILQSANIRATPSQFEEAYQQTQSMYSAVTIDNFYKCLIQIQSKSFTI